MSAPAAPITDYNAFRKFRIPVRQARLVCQKLGLPRPERLLRLERGEVSAAFRLEFGQREPLILKAYVRPPGPQALKAQTRVMDWVQHRTSIPTPRWLYAGPADDMVPYPFVVMEYAAGEDADTLWDGMSTGGKTRFVEACASILKKLHATEAKEVFDGAPADAGAWAASAGESFDGVLAQLRQQGWMKPSLLKACADLWLGRQDALAAAGPLAFVHYDFQPHNLRIDPDTQEILAVLDFDNAALAPPFTDARDLVLNVFSKEPGLAAAFWQTYGELDARQTAVLRLHCLSRMLGVMAAYWSPEPYGGTERLEELLHLAESP